jgi:hypothetical protein
MKHDFPGFLTLGVGVAAAAPFCRLHGDQIWRLFTLCGYV